MSIPHEVSKPTAGHSENGPVGAFDGTVGPAFAAVPPPNVNDPTISSVAATSITARPGLRVTCFPPPRSCRGS